MIYDSITINKSLVPYTFNILLGGETFEFRIDYNESYGFFTAQLSKDGTVYCSGEKIVYGKPLFGDVFIHGKFPNVQIVPYDTSGESADITFDNLSDTVNLLIDDQEVSLVWDGD